MLNEKRWPQIFWEIIWEQKQNVGCRLSALPMKFTVMINYLSTSWYDSPYSFLLTAPLEFLTKVQQFPFLMQWLYFIRSMVCLLFNYYNSTQLGHGWISEINKTWNFMKLIQIGIKDTVPPVISLFFLQMSVTLLVQKYFPIQNRPSRWQ